MTGLEQRLRLNSTSLAATVWSVLLRPTKFQQYGGFAETFFFADSKNRFFVAAP